MSSIKEIDGFPDYVIREDGVVLSTRTRRRCRPSRTQNGAVKVTLYKEGVPHTRSLALLVAKAHLYNDFDPEIFNTPIHLDNDPMNNHVENLMWRPRWFAVKYQRQYWNPEYRHSTVRVQDLRTGQGFDSLMEVCQTFGFLFHDVLKSCVRGEHVFPTWKVFGFID